MKKLTLVLTTLAPSALAFAILLPSPVLAFDDAASPVLRLFLGFGFEREKGEFVSVPDDPKLDFGPTDEMTLSVWVKLLERPDNGVYHILGKRSETCDGEIRPDMNYQLARDNEFGLHFNSDAGAVATSVDDLPLGAWTHIKVTYANFKLKIYVNRREVGSEHPYVLNGVNDAPLVIGGSDNCGDTFPGRIGSASIYRRVGVQNND